MAQRLALAALLVGALVAATACSSSGSAPSRSTAAPSVTSASPSTSPPSDRSTTSAAPTSTAVTSAAIDSAVHDYLDAVDRLCDGLLPKVIAVTGGGSLDIPVKDYLAQQPAHATLLADFDRQLAQVPVPPQAKHKAAVLAAYIRFANRLDAKRLAAAHRGEAAYAAEIRSEASIESDPAIVARNAAGFAESCDAR